MRVFLSAGEASGDAVGAALVTELARLDSSITFESIGGSRLSGCTAQLIDSSRWSAMGILQSLKMVPRAAKGFARAKKALLEGEPGLLIPIDYGFFNVRLARFAKSIGWKVLYFMPPGSWRRSEQGRDLAEVTDAVVTPFPWSREILAKQGVNAYWFGHPLKQLLGEEPTEARNSTGIAVLPGSRKHEIDLNLPVIAKVVTKVPEGTSMDFALAATTSALAMQERWAALSPERKGDAFPVGGARKALSRNQAALVCSGTATLEAALLRCPTVVLYRVSLGTVMQAKIAGFRPEFVSLPNLVLQRKAVPEHVGTKLDAEAIARDLNELMRDGPTRQAQLDAFDEIDELLGPSDAITKTAELALSMLK